MIGSKLIVILLISNVLRVLTGRNTDDFPELARHMTLAAEPNLSSYFSQRLTSLDQALCMPDAHTLQIGIRRHANFRPENAQEIVRTERYVLSQRIQCNAFGEMFIDVLAYLLYCSFLFSRISFLGTDIGISSNELSHRRQNA